MGSLVSPEVPSKIHSDDMFTDDGKESFRKSMKEHGFVIFTMNETLCKAVNNYFEETKIYFSQPMELKTQLSKSMELMKKNEGYLLVDGVKEYLKLKKDEINEEYFSFQSEFTPKFKCCWEQFYDLVHTCFMTLATTKTNDGIPYVKEELTKVVCEHMKSRSSISVIHYFPRPPPKEGEKTQQYDEEGMNNPSKVHTDTGILTFIMCSDVAGLQVENRETGDFIPVETLNTPKKDLFCIMGRKMEIFGSGGEDIYKATVHRVILPYNVERYSILFFADVPS